MGGEAVIDGLKTLVLAGTLRQQVEGGDYSAGVRTTFLYPDRVRRDVTVAGGQTISTVFTAHGSFLIGPQGSIDLPVAERERLEAAAMRNPLSLLKARRHPLFRASVSNPSGPGAAGRDILTIGIADQVTEVVIDSEGRIVEIAYQGTSGPESAEKAEFRVRYSDFRKAGPLVYPFSAEASFGGRPAYSLRLDSLRVNEELPPTLFYRPTAAPGPPAPSPTAVSSPPPGRSR